MQHNFSGDTGPLVYPAGFVYIYSILYFATSRGKNIHLAQYIFLAIYILQLTLTFRIYSKTKKVPPYSLVLATLTSYRIHSIYVLRLFNDPIAMLLLYASLNLFISSRWTLGSVLYSLAVSVKMNILLFAPALLAAYIIVLGPKRTAYQIALCAAVQLALGLPFLCANALGYVNGSFDLGRVFEHEWTVNYRFLDRDTFEDRRFHLALLVVHVLLLLAFAPMVKRYVSSYASLRAVESELKPQMKPKQKKRKPKPKEEALSKDQQKFLDSYEQGLKSRGHKRTEAAGDSVDDEDYSINFDSTSQLLVLPFFVVNFIGVVCARSLHYQFYAWYFHSLLYLVYCTGYRRSVMFLLLALIEYCWNCYPSTSFSSGVLHFCHVLILLGVYRMMRR